MTMTRRRKPPNGKQLKIYITATVFGAFAGSALLALMALAMSLFQLPAEWAEGMTLFCLGISALISGAVCGRACRKKGLATGAKAGLILWALCFAGAVISGGVTGSSAVSKLLVCLITGCTGGVMGVNFAEENR